MTIKDNVKNIKKQMLLEVGEDVRPTCDKISKLGIGSLTASERRQLDRERERLLKNSE